MSAPRYELVDSEFEQAGYGVHWTYDDMDYRYRNGRVSQDEWESYNALHTVAADRYGPPYSQEVARLIVAIGDALERPLETPAAAAGNLAAARQQVTS